MRRLNSLAAAIALSMATVDENTFGKRSPLQPKSVVQGSLLPKRPKNQMPAKNGGTEYKTKKKMPLTSSEEKILSAMIPGRAKKAYVKHLKEKYAA